MPVSSHRDVNAWLGIAPKSSPVASESYRPCHWIPESMLDDKHFAFDWNILLIKESFFKFISWNQLPGIHYEPKLFKINTAFLTFYCSAIFVTLSDKFIDFVKISIQYGKRK